MVLVGHPEFMSFVPLGFKEPTLYTVEPRYSKPLYSKVLAITKDFFYPRNSKIYGREPGYNQTSLKRANNFASPLALCYINLPLYFQKYCISQEHNLMMNQYRENTLHFLTWLILFLLRESDCKTGNRSLSACPSKQNITFIRLNAVLIGQIYWNKIKFSSHFQ